MPDFFGKATQYLAEKAGAASIDWAALAAKNQDSVYNPAYMDQYLLPAFQRCSRVMDTLDIKRGTPAELVANYFDIKDKLGDTADKLLKKVGNVVTVVNPLFATTLSWSAYNNIIYYTWAVALTSANMHITAQIHKSGIPDADIAYHASLTTMMFNVISRLDDFGALKPLKKGSTQGLGAVPLAAVIAIGIMVVIAIAWAVVSIFEISQRNEIVKAACVKATESGDPAAIENCQKIFATPEGSVSGAPGRALNELVQKVSLAAMIGAGLYILVQFGPGIATKIKQTVTSYKAS